MHSFSITPLRVSLFGGGSDYEEYFLQKKGAFIGGSIDKFIYIYNLPMSQLAPKKFKLSYRLIEEVDKISDLSHPVVREGLKSLKWNKPINISTMSDIPGGSGLGSSSAFTVGFLNLMNHIKNNSIDKITLINDAYNLEHNILKENIGVQDHIHSSYGGLSMYEVSNQGLNIIPLNLGSQFRKTLNDSMMLVYSGEQRHASKVLTEQIQNTKKKINHKEIKKLVELTYSAKELLNSDIADKLKLRRLGKYLSEGWALKQKFSKSISNNNIDNIYQEGMNLGAYGGKLCGAGGGGFVLFLADKATQSKIKSHFGNKNVLPIKFISKGSEVKSI